MNRRGFLLGLFAAPAIIAVERLMPVSLFRETIYGDGIHDDWAGIRAWIAGDPVDIRVPGFHRKPGVFHIGKGLFRCSKTLQFPSRHWIKGCSAKTTILQFDQNVTGVEIAGDALTMSWPDRVIADGTTFVASNSRPVLFPVRQELPDMALHLLHH
jgi:hypothetical protein